MTDQKSAEEAALKSTRSKQPVVIRRITMDELLPVRWPVLREGLPIESAIFPGDDAPETQHLGVYSEDQLVSVASLYRASFPNHREFLESWQLRGMATIPPAQRQGFGSVLLVACIEAVRNVSGEILWCNARTAAAPFYLRHRFVISGDEFEIAGVGPHYRMWRALS